MSKGDSLTDLVREYWEDQGCGPSLQEYLDHFKGLPSLAEAINLAGYRKDGKTVHDHQRLVGKKRLKQVSQLLLRHIDKIEACESFADLHDLIATCTVPIRGFGVLARYDIPLRIGAFLDLWPQVVYLHAGAAKGCKALGVNFTGNQVEKSLLPKALQSLAPHHAENFLCIYKDRFGKDSEKSKPKGC